MGTALRANNSSTAIILSLSLAAGTGGVLGGILIGKKQVKTQAANTVTEVAERGEGEATPHVSALLPLGESLVVNLTDREGKAFLRVGVQLGLAGQIRNSNDSNASLTPVARDTAITLLTTKTSDELLTPQGKERVKEQLRDQLRHRLPQMRIADVYFTEFLVQR